MIILTAFKIIFLKNITLTFNMSSIFLIFSEYLQLLSRHFNVHMPGLKALCNCVYCNLGSANLVVLLLAYHVDQVTVRQSGCPFQQNFRCSFATYYIHDFDKNCLNYQLVRKNGQFCRKMSR